MQIAPETDIILLKTPFEMSDTNQLTFSNATTQYNYFNSLPKLELTDATYQRKDGVVRWAGRFDDVIKYNYCMYRNSSFSNKWFYAYIEDVIFNNANMTEIKLKTDVFQSWQFDIIYRRSFVEREHVNNDTVGLHTIPENVDTGDYICNLADDINIGDSNLLVFMCSDFPPLLEQYFKNSTYNGVFSGGKAIFFINNQDASYFVQYMENQAMSDAIISLFILPNSIIHGDLTFITKELDFDPSIFGINKKEISFGYTTASEGETFLGRFDIPINTTLNGYTPKNNKLLTGKYNYLYITNNSGENIELHYEDFINNTPSFECIGAFGVGGSIKLLPTNYLKYNTENKPYSFYNYGINCGKYPVCSWNSDSYTVWLSENSLNRVFKGAEILQNTITAGFNGDINKMGNVLNSVTNSIKEHGYHYAIPNQAKGNTNLGELQYASNKMGFTLYKMSVRNEYAKVIDDYFSMFGYKINEVKVPNIIGRRNWNYVKTIDINIIGDIPQKDLEEIRKIFDNGITLWHNPSTFLDYSQSNPIV